MKVAGKFATTSSTRKLWAPPTTPPWVSTHLPACSWTTRTSTSRHRTITLTSAHMLERLKNIYSNCTDNIAAARARQLECRAVRAARDEPPSGVDGTTYHVPRATHSASSFIACVHLCFADSSTLDTIVMGQLSRTTSVTSSCCPLPVAWCKAKARKLKAGASKIPCSADVRIHCHASSDVGLAKDLK